jgi:hypothetical protein
MQTKISLVSDFKFNLETWRKELSFHFDEMCTFEEKLEEVAEREYNKNALIPLEQFQNRILIEKDVISKLKHRCKNELTILNSHELNENYFGEHKPIVEDMRTYIKMHYELKEEITAYFLKWLD